MNRLRHLPEAKVVWIAAISSLGLAVAEGMVATAVVSLWAVVVVGWIALTDCAAKAEGET
jgi:hypothetical protein